MSFPFIIYSTSEQQLEELQDKYDAQGRECSNLSTKLDSVEVRYLLFLFDLCGLHISLMPMHSQKELEKTSNLLASTQESLRKCQYVVKERDFVISEQKRAGIFN